MLTLRTTLKLIATYQSRFIDQVATAVVPR